MRDVSVVEMVNNNSNNRVLPNALVISIKGQVCMKIINSLMLLIFIKI